MWNSYFTRFYRIYMTFYWFGRCFYPELNILYIFHLYSMRIKLTWFTWVFFFWVKLFLTKSNNYIIYFVILMFNSGHIMWNTFYWIRARFNNSLGQRKPSFGVKRLLSGFTKDAQWRNSTENAWTVIFVPDLIECAFVGVSLSEAKFMGGEY